MYIYCSLLADHTRPFQCTLLCNALLLGCSISCSRKGTSRWDDHTPLQGLPCPFFDSSLTHENLQACRACNCTKTDTKIWPILARMPAGLKFHSTDRCRSSEGPHIQSIFCTTNIHTNCNNASPRAETPRNPTGQQLHLP
jgi:hypothetical protein